MHQGFRWCCVVALWATAFVDVSAQDYVGLPLRLDLVHDPAGISPTFFNEGCFENTNPTTATGYTAMPATQTQDPASPVTPFYGWNSAASSRVWKILPSDVTVAEIWACLLAFELEPLASIYSLAPGDSTPDHDALYAQVVNGHSWHSATRDFTAFVPPGTDRVLVRVLIGRPDEQIKSTRIHAATQTSCGQSVTYQPVLLEEFPDPDLGYNDGIWTRTMMQKASLTEAVGGWRSIWFFMDTLCDGSDERVQFQVESAWDQTIAAAVEIYRYQPGDSPPVFFDETDLASPLKVNTSYSFGSGSDQLHVTNGIDDLAVLGNASDAKQDFDQIQDPVTRAEALLWLVGWLGGDRSLFGHDGFEWECLLTAIGELELIDVEQDPRGGFVAHHLEMAKKYRRGLLHERMGGVPRAVMADGSEYINWYRKLEDDFNAEDLYPDINVGLLNLNAAEALWRDTGGQQLGPAYGNAHMEVHPLLFKSLTYAAINTWARHTKNKNVSVSQEAVYFVKQHFDLAREFATLGLCVDASPFTGENEGPFGQHDSLAMLNHLATWDAKNPLGDPDYDENDEGGIVQKWGGEGADSVHGPGESTWWDTELIDAAAIDPGNPACSDNVWARQLRRFDVAHQAAHSWWAEAGALDHELGGGDGDDPEFVLQMVYPTLPFPGRNPQIEATAQGVTDTWLAAWGPAPEGTGDFYFGDGSASAADVEHTGEYTGNGLWAMLQLRYGDPWYLEYALQSTQYLGDDVWGTGGAQEGGAPWTELHDADAGNPFGAGPVKHSDPETAGFISYRRFVNWHMDAEGSWPLTGSGGSAVGDLVLNGRAILPAFYVAAHNRHSGTVRLLRQWAEWWWVVLMDDGTLADAASTPSQAKPAGVPPALVQYASSFPYLEYGEPDGGAGAPNWWIGPYGFDSALASCDYVYGTMLWRYLDPETESTERHEYLLPIYRAGQLLGEYWRLTLDRDGTPLGPGPIVSLTQDSIQGSAWWTAKKLSKNSAFRRVLTHQLPYLEADTDLASEPFHANLIEYLMAGLACQDPSTWTPGQFPITGCDGYAKALYNDDVGSDGDKDILEQTFATGYDWLDAFFGLATTWVSYVDRIYVSVNGANAETLSVLTQGYLSSSIPNTTLSWESLPGEPALEIAALAKGWQVDAVTAQDVWRVLVVNFEPDTGGPTTTARLRFRHGLSAGSYDLYVGPSDGTDAIAAGQATYVDTLDVGYYGSNGFVDVGLPNDSSGTSCGAEVVIELRNFVPESLSPDTFADPAVSTHDFLIYVDNDQLYFDLPLHNVGTEAVSGVTGRLSMAWYLQTTNDPPPDETTTFISLADVSLGPTGSVAGWSDGFTPSATVPLEEFDPTPWVWGTWTMWVKATLTIDSSGTGDKLENNSVSTLFELNSSP